MTLAQFSHRISTQNKTIYSSEDHDRLVLAARFDLKILNLVNIQQASFSVNYLFLIRIVLHLRPYSALLLTELQIGCDQQLLVIL